MTTPIPETPHLQIVPLDALMEHEYNDAQRTAPLLKRIQADGVLKNPPIVSPLDEAAGRFVVLDGANRSTALQQLGYPHCLVQVVEYKPPQVTLSTWHHAITHMDLPRFTEALKAVDGLELRAVDLLSARAELARRDLIAYIIRADGQVLAARSLDHQLHAQNRVLNALVDQYKLAGKLHRTVSDDLAETQLLYPSLAALVVFPNYETAEVLALARDGELLPPGLTRHLIQGRVLRTNYPLEELRSSEPLPAKNARLQAWLKQKYDQRETRFYGEATFLFDE